MKNDYRKKLFQIFLAIQDMLIIVMKNALELKAL